MSAIFITKSLQTMDKGPSRRRLWMYTEKKIILWSLLYLAYQQKIGIWWYNA